MDFIWEQYYSNFSVRMLFLKISKRLFENFLNALDSGTAHTSRDIDTKDYCYIIKLLSWLIFICCLLFFFFSQYLLWGSLQNIVNSICFWNFFIIKMNFIFCEAEFTSPDLFRFLVLNSLFLNCTEFVENWLTVFTEHRVSSSQFSLILKSTELYAAYICICFLLILLFFRWLYSLSCWSLN